MSMRIRFQSITRLEAVRRLLNTDDELSVFLAQRAERLQQRQVRERTLRRTKRLVLVQWDPASRLCFPSTGRWES